MAKDFPDGYHNRPHKHERAQLIFAAHGAMLVATSAGSWAVPPQRAVWMPAGLVHEIRMIGAVAMRTLYIREDAAARLTPSVRVLAVSPLLRELILRADDLEIDLISRRIIRGGLELDLTRREYELLEFLVRHKNATVTREMIGREVWKEASGALTNTIDVYINALRKKVEQPGKRQLIHTVRGVGYAVRDRA